jgi:ADP-heptose:LPS heptosyltransferase
MTSLLQRIEQSLRLPLYKLASLFVTSKEASLPLDGHSMKRILLIRDDRIGDMVVSLPLFQFLKETFPHIQIDVLCTQYNVSVLQENPNVSQKYLLPKSLFRRFFFFRKLRKNNYDCIVSLVLSKKSRYGSFCQIIQSNNTITVGFVQNRFEVYSKIFSIMSSIPFEEYTMTEVLLRWFSLLFAVEYNPSYMLTPLIVPETSKQYVANFFDQQNFQNQFIAYNISASDIRRQLTDNTHIELITMILEAYPHYNIVLLSIPKDQNTVDLLLSQFGRRVISFPATKNINDTIALIERSAAVISPNTAITHVAASLDIPLLEIYSTLAPSDWRPKHAKFRFAKTDGDQYSASFKADEIFVEFQALMEGQYSVHSV